MKLSPIRVSFDGPLDRRERRRASLLAIALGGTVLFLASGGLTMVLNASSGLLAAWTNGTSEVSTTGVASPVERIKPAAPVQPVLGAATAVRAEAVTAAKPKSKSETKARVKSTRNSQSPNVRQARERRRPQDEATIERQWRERSAEIERRSPRNDFQFFR